MFVLKIFALILCFTFSLLANSRVREVKQRVAPELRKALTQKGLSMGAPVYLRAFKAERELEVWIKPRGIKSYRLFRRYPIAGMSGDLGPKLKEGDRQAPEGFYNIYKKSLNPRSKYHLSFNIGYPNKYDRYHKRTGSFIMVHGSRYSIGCYAMTDPVIEELYLIVEAALKKGNSPVPFHCFPFRYKKNWERSRSYWNRFWNELEPAYLMFEKNKRIPRILIKKGIYKIQAPN